MKNKIVLFISGCIALFLSSCLGSDEIADYELSKDCQITAFSLSHDSVAGLKNVKFTIDQLNGLIFNKDSMPYGTEVDKVICSIKYGGGTYTIQVVQEAKADIAEEDTIYWNTTDSLDFSKPVKFITTAVDMVTTKTYIAKLNIHQVVPDSMSWSLYSDDVTGLSLKEEKVITYNTENADYYYMYACPSDVSKGYLLYRSSVADAKSWKALPMTGLPAGEALILQITDFNGVLYVPTTKGALYQSANGQDWTLVEQSNSIKSLLGSIHPTTGDRNPSVMAFIINNAGTLTFAGMDKDSNWTIGETVPAGFPIAGFANTEYSSQYYARLMLAAGRDKDNALTNSVWATTDAGSWALLTDRNVKTPDFEKREGAMLTRYDDQFFLIGGLDEAGKGLKDMYTSIDNGVTWALRDTLIALPDSYKGCGFSSIQVDKEQYMLIFGGKESSNGNVLDQIWRGRINRLGFKE